MIRPATDADLPALARHRAGMFIDMGRADPASAGAVRAGTEEWLRSPPARARWIAFVSEEAGAVVASGTLLLRHGMPRPDAPRGGVDGLLLSVFTEHAHRRRGHARAVVSALVSAAWEVGVGTLRLHATEVGRPLYASLGFVAGNEMTLRAPAAGPGANPAGARSTSRTGDAPPGGAGPPPRGA